MKDIDFITKYTPNIIKAEGRKRFLHHLTMVEWACALLVKNSFDVQYALTELWSTVMGSYSYYSYPNPIGNDGLNAILSDTRNNRAFNRNLIKNAKDENDPKAFRYLGDVSGEKANYGFNQLYEVTTLIKIIYYIINQDDGKTLIIENGQYKKRFFEVLSTSLYSIFASFYKYDKVIEGVKGRDTITYDVDGQKLTFTTNRIFIYNLFRDIIKLTSITVDLYSDDDESVVSKINEGTFGDNDSRSLCDKKLDQLQGVVPDDGNATQKIVHAITMAVHNIISNYHIFNIIDKVGGIPSFKGTSLEIINMMSSDLAISPDTYNILPHIFFPRGSSEVIKKINPIVTKLVFGENPISILSPGITHSDTISFSYEEIKSQGSLRSNGNISSTFPNFKPAITMNNTSLVPYTRLGDVHSGNYFIAPNLDKKNLYKNHYYTKGYFYFLGGYVDDLADSILYNDGKLCNTMLFNFNNINDSLTTNLDSQYFYTSSSNTYKNLTYYDQDKLIDIFSKYAAYKFKPFEDIAVIPIDSSYKKIVKSLYNGPELLCLKEYIDMNSQCEILLTGPFNIPALIIDQNINTNDTIQFSMLKSFICPILQKRIAAANGNVGSNPFDSDLNFSAHHLRLPIFNQIRLGLFIEFLCRGQIDDTKKIPNGVLESWNVDYQTDGTLLTAEDIGKLNFDHYKDLNEKRGTN